MNEAELLFTDLLQCSRVDLYRRKKTVLGVVHSAAVAEVLRRRCAGLPLQYILGKADFFGLTIKVSPRCLVPRPETEILVEAALRVLAGRTLQTHGVRVLDIGTGSGCIAIALAKHCPQAQIDAVDISGGALAVAKDNAAACGVKVNFFHSDLFPSGSKHPAVYDLVVTNPPYIPRSQIRRLQPEVRYEPRCALDGGPDGLDFFRRIIRTLPGYLPDGGCAIVEVGCGQRQAVQKIFDELKKFEIIEVIKDYNHIDRVVVARKLGSAGNRVGGRVS
jgi:release factor glutamine methyltransferase